MCFLNHKPSLFVFLAINIAFHSTNANLVSINERPSSASPIESEILAQSSLQRNPSSSDNLSPSSSIFTDEFSGKNDDSASHLRLFYKSNSPSRSISHRLEHKYLKNDPIVLSQNRQDTGAYKLIQAPYPSIYSNNPYISQQQLENLQLFQSGPIDPVYSNQNDNAAKKDEEKNMHTMLNLHYHGKSIDGLGKNFDSFYKTEC